LNNKGDVPGPAQTPAKKSGSGGQGKKNPLQLLSNRHDLKKAAEDCLDCSGTGRTGTRIMQADKSYKDLVCYCVPLKEKKEARPSPSS
jgi:hypothetical protein